MTLLPFVSRRLLGALGLVFLCSVSIAYLASVQAAELQGALVPLDSNIPAASTASIPATRLEAPESVTAVEPSSSVDAAIDASAPAHNEAYALNELEQRIEQLLQEHGGRVNLDLVQLVPIVAIIFSVGGPIFLIGFLIAKRYQNKQLRQQSLNNNIDKLLAAGRDIPVELLRGDEPQSSGASGNRDKGIRNIFIGAGLLAFLTILAGISIGAIGFIWIALGLSQVIIWSLNEPKAGQSQSQQVGPQD